MAPKPPSDLGRPDTPVDVEATAPRPGGRLADRRVLIVGGTSGIGLACAQRFAREGARLVVTGKTAEEVDRAELPSGAEARALDVLDESAVVATLNEIVDGPFEGRLDVLVHSSGVSARGWGDGPLHQCAVEGFDHAYQVNARGAFLTNRQAVNAMRRQSLDVFGIRGAILNIGSVLARHPAPEHFGTLGYAASKGALESLSLAAAAMYAPERIRINVLAPALIATPMSRRALEAPEIQAYLRVKQPLAEGPGTPENCAHAALALCEPEARFLTGVVLPVDGGWHLVEPPTTISKP